MDCQYCCYYLVFIACWLCYCVIASHSDWPEGYYGLPMANTGCPSGASFDWKSGWIYQDTEDNNPGNDKSVSFHIEGQVLLSSINRSFCIKTQITNDQRRPVWPAGTYCIYQRTNYCPLGFNSGFIKWDDENSNNRNKAKGTLPKVDSGNSDTKIYFCCRNDGYKSNSIDLPTNSPFYLFAHQQMSCQQVRWAVATSEWIEYDTEDDSNHDQVPNAAPYVKPTSYGQKIYYCYYTSCQYTLNASNGMINFPRHPGNYANGQLCSWRITVKAFQTIEVHFAHFRLSDVNDRLIFYDGKDESDPLLATLHGKNTESEITSQVWRSKTADLFVVFRSNRVNTASGFQASYNAIGTPAATTAEVTTAKATTAEATTAEATTAEATTAEATTTARITTTRTKAKTTTARITTTRTKAKTTTARITTRKTTEAQVVTEKTKPTELASSSSNPTSKLSSEPSSLPKFNSSKNHEAFKKTCIQQSQSTLTAVAIVLPLICLIAVIGMAVYLFLRLRKLHKKPSDVSLRYTATTESVNNPAYIPSDAVIEARAPSTNIEYEDNKGDIYHEIEPSRQTTATDNPLYQSSDEDKHVYASFA